MNATSSNSPSPESASRPSAIKTLRRFSFVAWHASPFGAIMQALITLIYGCIPVGTLWASRGLVNLIAAILANETEPSLQTAAPWVIALASLAILRNVTGTYDSYLRWKMQGRIKLHQQRALIEAATYINFALFDQPQTYDLIQRARQALGHRLTNVLRFLTEIGQLFVTLVGYGVLLWIADPLLVLVVVLPAIPSAWLKVRSAESGYIHDYDATPIRRMMAYTLQSVARFILRTGSSTLWTEGSSLWTLANESPEMAKRIACQSLATSESLYRYNRRRSACLFSRDFHTCRSNCGWTVNHRRLCRAYRCSGDLPKQS